MASWEEEEQKIKEMLEACELHFAECQKLSWCREFESQLRQIHRVRHLNSSIRRREFKSLSEDAQKQFDEDKRQFEEEWYRLRKLLYASINHAIHMEQATGRVVPFWRRLKRLVRSPSFDTDRLGAAVLEALDERDILEEFITASNVEIETGTTKDVVWSKWIYKQDIVKRLDAGAWKTLMKHNGTLGSAYEVENCPTNNKKGRYRVVCQLETTGTSGNK